MKALFTILVTVLFTIPAYSAEPASKENNQASANVGLAMVVLADDQNSIVRDNKVYHRIIGKLQREMKRADFSVFNGMLPADQQPDWSLGLDAVSESADRLNNPWVDMIVVVNASVDNSGKDAEISLHLRLMDIATGAVLQQLEEKKVLASTAHCQNDCSLAQVNNELVQLSAAILPELVYAVGAEFNANESNFRVAQR